MELGSNLPRFEHQISQGALSHWCNTLSSHTEHPEAYRKVSKNMILVEEGKKYTL